MNQPVNLVSTPAAPLVINQLQQLRVLANRAYRGKQLIVLRLPNLSEQDAFAHSERLNRYRSECGCKLGAQCMTAGFIFTAALLITHYGLFTTALLWRFPIVLAAAIVSAGIGKFVGLTLARKKLRGEIESILNNITNQSERE